MIGESCSPSPVSGCGGMSGRFRLPDVTFARCVPRCNGNLGVAPGRQPPGIGPMAHGTAATVRGDHGAAIPVGEPEGGTLRFPGPSRAFPGVV